VTAVDVASVTAVDVASVTAVDVGFWKDFGSRGAHPGKNRPLRGAAGRGLGPRGGEGAWLQKWSPTQQGMHYTTLRYTTVHLTIGCANFFLCAKTQNVALTREFL